MWHNNKYESGIVAENLSFGLSSAEIEEIERKLNEHEIGLLFIEKRGVQSSIFNTLYIYINAHLTELIVASLLAPAAYDAIKYTISFLIEKVKCFFRKADESKPIVSLKLNIGKAEIIAPIPSNLNDEQFSYYMDMLQNSLVEIASIQNSNEKKYEYFVVEYSDDQKSLKIKTVTEYGAERAAEQRRKRERE